MKKYEITDIAHPDNPKLHRIRALTDVGADVHKGDFGGYVETEDNLDQEGFAWIGEDAIACEDSYIGGDISMVNFPSLMAELSATAKEQTASRRSSRSKQKSFG